jgi:hypothetical protein
MSCLHHPKKKLKLIMLLCCCVVCCSQIQYVKTTSGNPSDAKPFSTAYGTDVSRNNNMILNAAALVAPVRGQQFKVWAIVTNPIGQAECHFKSTEDKCQK